MCAHSALPGLPLPHPVSSEALHPAPETAWQRALGSLRLHHLIDSNQGPFSAGSSLGDAKLMRVTVPDLSSTQVPLDAFQIFLLSSQPLKKDAMDSLQCGALPEKRSRTHLSSMLINQKASCQDVWVAVGFLPCPSYRCACPPGSQSVS